MNEPPNPEAQKFYGMLDPAQRPIWPGSRMSELEAAERLMSIKSNYNVFHNCFDEFAGLMKEACPDGNSLPSNFSEVKKIVGKLGLTAEKIDCCPKGCMLYYNRHNHSIYKVIQQARQENDTSSHKRLKLPIYMFY